MLNTTIVVAKDISGKCVCLWAGATADAHKALEAFEDDEALEKTGLVGEVEIGFIRDPHLYQKRHVTVKPKAKK